MKKSPKGRYETEVITCKKVSPSSFIIELSKPERFPGAMPGQFISIRVSGVNFPLLRRPYSILDMTDDHIALLVKIVGRGSEALASLKTGDLVDFIGPLGSTYFELDKGTDAVFVAGGTGLAPLVFAARMWSLEGRAQRMDLLYGTDDSSEVLADIFKDDFSQVYIATIDGSRGFEGNVVEMFKDLTERGILPEGKLYSCGPSGMVKALVNSGTHSFIDHYTSLESVMACGVGACRGCVVPVTFPKGAKYKSVCGDGTVFRAEDIDWDNWRGPGKD
ncbi:MAG: FAD-binding oxidoreductase [Candidatus Krumholzibacteriota bacterium]|nr:FAD-binding oxidoreductase [Candidatus Krumholzibacteriota bacterium]